MSVSISTMNEPLRERREDNDLESFQLWPTPERDPPRDTLMSNRRPIYGITRRTPK